MGELIRLRPRQEARPASSPVATATGGDRDSATILLFTGVRYERHDGANAPAVKPQARRGGGRRKRA